MNDGMPLNSDLGRLRAEAMESYRRYAEAAAVVYGRRIVMARDHDMLRWIGILSKAPRQEGVLLDTAASQLRTQLKEILHGQLVHDLSAEGAAMVREAVDVSLHRQELALAMMILERSETQGFGDGPEMDKAKRIDRLHRIGAYTELRIDLANGWKG